jgi:hypothetical protein
MCCQPPNDDYAAERGPPRRSLAAHPHPSFSTLQRYSPNRAGFGLMPPASGLAKRCTPSQPNTHALGKRHSGATRRFHSPAPTATLDTRKDMRSPGPHSSCHLGVTHFRPSRATVGRDSDTMTCHSACACTQANRVPLPDGNSRAPIGPHKRPGARRVRCVRSCVRWGRFRAA